MSRHTLQFLRPYLKHSTQSAVKPELARAYCAFQRRFAHSVAADAYTGRHDVEKQKRLEQLRQMRDLSEYHPRLAHDTNGERLSLKGFHERYEGSLKDRTDESVSVFGMVTSLNDAGHIADNSRQGASVAQDGFQADVPRH